MNNKTIKRFFLFLGLIASSLSLNAQTITCYFPQEYEVDADSTLTVVVKVDSLTNVGGFGFSVNWDSTVLKYVGYDSLGIELNEFSGFNVSKANEGKIGLSWLSPTAIEGLSLPDSTTFFALTFEAIGDSGDTTSLSFTNDPTPREFANLNADLLSANFINGFVTLTGMAATSTNFNSAPEKISLYPPTPNPFHESTLIQFDLQKATQANIQIMDQLGRVVYEDRQYLPAGTQNMSISKEIFQHSGTYYWVMHTKDFRVTQKIMFLER